MLPTLAICKSGFEIWLDAVHYHENRFITIQNSSGAAKEAT